MSQPSYQRLTSGAESFPRPASRLMARQSFSAPPGMHDRMNCSPRGSAARNRARWDWRTAESSRCRRREKWRSFWDLSPFLEGSALARASLAGGLPREVLERVTEADWGPDGALAVVKQGRTRWSSSFQSAPSCTRRGRSGRCVFRQRAIALRSSSRGSRRSRNGRGGRCGPFPQDDHPGEAIDGSRPRLVLQVTKCGSAALDPTARQRFAPCRSPAGSGSWSAPAPLKINDISRNGRVLVTKGLNLGGITCLIPGETREREVGWLDFAYVEGLSPTAGQFSWRKRGIGHQVYTRATDGAPAIRLGDATPSRCRPDGKWVLARRRSAFGVGA